MHHWVLSCIAAVVLTVITVQAANISYVPSITCEIECSFNDAIWSSEFPPGANDTVTIESATPITIFIDNAYVEVLTLSISGNVTFHIFNNSVLNVTLTGDYFRWNGSNVVVEDSFVYAQNVDGNLLEVKNGHFESSTLWLNTGAITSSYVHLTGSSWLSFFADKLFVNDSTIHAGQFTVLSLISYGYSIFNVSFLYAEYASFNDNPNLVIKRLQSISGIWTIAIEINDCNAVIDQLLYQDTSSLSITASSNSYYSNILQLHPLESWKELWVGVGDGANLTISQGALYNVTLGNHAVLNFVDASALPAISFINQKEGDAATIYTNTELRFLNDTQFHGAIYLQQEKSSLDVAGTLTLSSPTVGHVISGAGGIALTSGSLNCPDQTISVAYVTLGAGTLTVGTLFTPLINFPLRSIPYDHFIHGDVVVSDGIDFDENALSISGNYTQTGGTLNVTIAYNSGYFPPNNSIPYLQVGQSINISEVDIHVTVEEPRNFTEWLFIQSPEKPVAADFKNSRYFPDETGKHLVVEIENGDVYLKFKYDPAPSPSGKKPWIKEHWIYLAIGGGVVVAVAVGVSIFVVRRRKRSGYQAVF